jgi:hypothetical protein
LDPESHNTPPKLKLLKLAAKAPSRVQFSGVNEEEEEKSPAIYSRDHPISKSVTSLRDF